MKSLHIINYFSSLFCSIVLPCTCLSSQNLPFATPSKSREARNTITEGSLRIHGTLKAFSLAGHGHLCFSTEDFWKKESHLGCLFPCQKAIRETASNKATGLKVSDNDFKKIPPHSKKTFKFSNWNLLFWICWGLRKIALPRIHCALDLWHQFVFGPLETRPTCIHLRSIQSTNGTEPISFI